jgi:glucose/mannose-6-phosphate isomerase
MDKLIDAFPHNIIESLEIASKYHFTQPKRTIQNVVICGMGGSGIGGKIISQWIQDEVKTPITLVQDYSLPAFVNDQTLVIGCSYSGNTEETLYALNDAKSQGAHIIGLCSGGKLQAFCESNGYEVVLVPGGNPPRTTLAFSLGQLLNIFSRLGLIEIKNLEKYRSCAPFLLNHQDEIKNEARCLATFIKGKNLLMYSASNYEAVAIRARQQFNENSKILCIHHVIPEMNHNELVGWGLGNDSYGVLFFDSKDWFDRNRVRMEFSREHIQKKNAHTYTLEAKGENIMERSMYFINVVDWASFYLAEMNEVDPIEIDVINELKGMLDNY